jgi:predicted AAA+ superfamily ATPase
LPNARDLLNVGDIEIFGRFVRFCAGRSGQLLNASSLAADVGVSHATIRRWLAILEASFVIYLLRPHHRNFNVSLVRLDVNLTPRHPSEEWHLSTRLDPWR